MPVTAVAPANIALVKCWGLADGVLGVPANRSLSMTLRSCVSRCTVERAARDEVWWSDHGRARPAEPGFAGRVTAHLDRLRKTTGQDTPLRVVTAHTFPSGTAATASGFAALTIAAMAQFGAQPGPGDLSDLARRSGSGSAARSVLGGFVIWPESATLFTAAQVLPESHWDLHDVIAVVDSHPRTVSAAAGHRRITTSPHFGTRVAAVEERLERVLAALRDRDFPALAESVEEEMYDMHAIALTARPPLRYWKPGTLAVLDLAERMRSSGLPVCATTDAGPNVHLLCPAEAASDVAEMLSGACESVIVDRVGPGPALSGEHLAVEP